MEKDIKNLKVFSKKLNGVMDVFSKDDKLIPATVNAAWLDNGWNNFSDSWLDNGWNNSFSSWTDNGWSNFSDSWLDNGWNNSSWTDSGWSNSGSGGGCYITTATVEHLGLADDCEELNILRKYRDKLVEEDPEFKKVVLEYYKIAPIIVEKISNSSNKNEILDSIYSEMVVPVIGLLKQGKINEAKECYLNTYNSLKYQYVEAQQLKRKR